MGDALLPEAILPMTLLHYAVFGVIFWLIARRCIKDPISGGFASKRLALGSFAVISLAACIDIAVIDWQHQLNEAPFIINYGFVMIIQVPLAIILSAAMSVSKGNYLKGLHRFKRIPAKANPYWSSTAVNIAAIFGLCSHHGTHRAHCDCVKLEIHRLYPYTAGYPASVVLLWLHVFATP